jgi:hypothetical protein
MEDRLPPCLGRQASCFVAASETSGWKPNRRVRLATGRVRPTADKMPGFR